MRELIREYGGVLLASLECLALFGVLGYLWMSMASYMEYFADRLMGG